MSEFSEKKHNVDERRADEQQVGPETESGRIDGGRDEPQQRNSMDADPSGVDNRTDTAGAAADDDTPGVGGADSDTSGVDASTDRRGGQAAGSGDDGGAEVADEADVLRNELMRLQEELAETRARLDEMKDRFMRARADLDNYRKRAAMDADRARDAGLDSAVLPVLSVFDDLRRALEAADTADPSAIVPGVQSVLATLERNLEALGIKAIGNVGESFDPDLHEALTSVPTDETDKSETIAEVFQLGFQKGDRLIRPARVVVYQS